MKSKTIFIFAYYSFLDPVFQSAVLPYFKGLGDDTKLRFVLLTFEQQRYKMTAPEIAEVEKELKNDLILWFQTNWHSGRFKIIKKVFDFTWGILFSIYLIIKYKPVAIYSEGFPGAVIAHHLAQFFALPHLIHTYEPHTDYMVEAGVWTERSWEARLLRKYEIIVAKGASHIFTATVAMVERLKRLYIKAQIHRVPSCVDHGLFNYSTSDRIDLRKEYDIRENDCVVTYLGKFGGMYMDGEIFDFFKVCEENVNLNFRYFIITPDPYNKVINYISEKKIDPSKFTIKTLPRKEISKYLSASDFGLVAIRQIPSRRYSSPIKDGEYWACGLPVLIPKGISDDYQFAKQNIIGIVMEDMGHKSLENTVEGMVAWLNKNDKEDVVKRCRTFVEKDRSIEKFKELYKKIFLEI